MQPIPFPQANRNLGRPPNMTEEECESLPVLTDGKVCVSLWKPTLKERLSILFFGRIWLFVFSGGSQPPVAIEAQRNIFGREKNANKRTNNS
jgi:hypothetical protein